MTATAASSAAPPTHFRRLYSHFPARFRLLLRIFLKPPFGQDASFYARAGPEYAARPRRENSGCIFRRKMI
jgi:hypothetical protein